MYQSAYKSVIIENATRQTEKIVNEPYLLLLLLDDVVAFHDDGNKHIKEQHQGEKGKHDKVDRSQEFVESASRSQDRMC